MSNDKRMERMGKVVAAGEYMLFKQYKHIVNYLKNRTSGLDRRHILVAGVQRSGTNMVMDVLERSLDTDVYHERDNRAFCNYEMRGMDVIHELADSSRSKYFVLKVLCELDIIEQLLEELKPCKAVWIVRNFNDVANSMLKSFPSQSAVIGRLVEDPSSNRWIGRGMSESTHQLIKELYRNGINDASGAALIWYLRNTLFFEKQLEEDARVRVVLYEDLVKDPLQEFRDLHEFFGMKLSPYAVRNIYASSVGKRRKPEISEKIYVKCDELYNRFRQHAKK